MGRSKQSYKRGHQSQAACVLKRDLVNYVNNYKSQIQTLEQKVELKIYRIRPYKRYTQVKT